MALWPWSTGLARMAHSAQLPGTFLTPVALWMRCKSRAVKAAPLVWCRLKDLYAPPAHWRHQHPGLRGNGELVWQGQLVAPSCQAAPESIWNDFGRSRFVDAFQDPCYHLCQQLPGWSISSSSPVHTPVLAPHYWFQLPRTSRPPCTARFCSALDRALLVL